MSATVDSVGVRFRRRPSGAVPRSSTACSAARCNAQQCNAVSLRRPGRAQVVPPARCACAPPSQRAATQPSACHAAARARLPGTHARVCVRVRLCARVRACVRERVRAMRVVRFDVMVVGLVVGCAHGAGTWCVRAHGCARVCVRVCVCVCVLRCNMGALRFQRPLAASALGSCGRASKQKHTASRPGW